jgi:choline dehydrogenase-like flavoprotein
MHYKRQWTSLCSNKPFKWIRGYQVGGRSLTWGRQCYRFSDLDFEANSKDGNGVDNEYDDLKNGMIMKDM